MDVQSYPLGTLIAEIKNVEIAGFRRGGSIMNIKEKTNDFENRYKLVIPILYKKFLQNENGISFNGGTILYSLNELKQMNDDLQIQKYQPDYIAIGDDGGGLVFLMKQDPDAKEVFCVDISDYDIETSFCRLEDFTKWYEDGCNICINETDKYKLSQAGDIFLKKLPKNGVADLVKIKKIFCLNISITELLSLSKELPCVLISGITHAKAIKLMEKFGQPDIFDFHEI